MSPNISEKEKKVLIILGIFVIIFIYFYIFFIPNSKKISELEKSIENFDNEVKLNQEYMRRVENLDSELKILYEKQNNLWTVLPPVINYDEVFVLIKDTAEKSNFGIVDMQFETVSALEKKKVDEVKDSESKEEAKDGDLAENKKLNVDNQLVKAMELFGLNGFDNNGEDESVINENEGYYLPARINGKGTYSQLKEFISLIKSKKNKMEFAEINVENSIDKDILTCNLRIFIFGIKDSRKRGFSILNNEKTNYLNESNEKNIFMPYAGIDMNSLDNNVNETVLSGINESNTEKNIEKNIENNVITNNQEYDFYIRLLPYGNNTAPPSISITGKNIKKNGDLVLIPNIYGDGNEIMNVDFYIEEKDGKYYVKYRTEQESFPDKTFAELAEFQPVGNELLMIVNSNKRQFKTDNSGIKLNVNNTSSKILKIKISNDDKSTPRVNIGNINEKVKLEYKDITD